MAHVGQHRAQRIRVARHFKTHVKAFFHAQFFLSVFDLFGAHIQRQGGPHFLSQFEAVGNHIGDHHIAGPGVFGNGGRHAADGSGAGDQYIFSQHVK